MTKELKINNKKIGENTEITVSVKNVLWFLGVIIGLFISVFTYTYLDTKSEFSTYKTEIEKSQLEFIEKLDTKIDDLEKRDINFINRFGTVEGNIKVILDRTSGRKINATPQSENTPPPSTS